MTSGNSSALNRLYYPLSEAAKVLKAQGKSLSVYDLLHYGVQGFVRFFIHLPPGMRARRILGLLHCENEQQPSLLILSPLQCGEIECNKMAKHSDFPSAYASLYSPQEIPPYPKDPESLEEINWQTVDSNDEITSIPITPKTIHIACTELDQLINILDGPYRPPVEFTPQFDEQIQQEINLRCYSFEDALKIAKEKINGFTEINLLRYGYFEKLTFLIQRPKNLSVAIVIQGDPPFITNIIPIPKPDLLALHPEDCYQIEILGSTTRTDFKFGFLCHRRSIIPTFPKPTPDLIFETVELSNVNIIENYRLRVETKLNGSWRWHTYNQRGTYALEINKNTLYVIRSEFDRLIAAESISNKIEQIESPYIPEFTISDIAKFYLSPKHFITLSDAANLAKCYTNELLIHASQGTIELLTPVPCEIAICQTRQPVNHIDELRESQIDIYASVEEIPQLFVLENEDCEAIAINGRIKRGYFKQGYSFKFSQLVRRTPYYQHCTNHLSQPNSTASDSNKREGVWMTFFLDKPKEIDITVDRIFIELSKFQELIKSSPDAFKTNNDSFIETERSVSDRLNSLGIETSSAVNCKTMRTDLIPDAISIEDISATEELVTVNEFMEMAGISRTTITNKSNDKVNYPDFPTKFENREKTHVYFIKSEVEAWIRKNPRHNRKRKQKPNKP